MSGGDQLPLGAATLCGIAFSLCGIATYVGTVEPQNDWLREGSVEVSAVELEQAQRERERVTPSTRRSEPANPSPAMAAPEPTTAEEVETIEDDPRSELRLDAGLLEFLREKYSIYEELGALDRFRREQDPVPLRPLIPIEGIDDNDLMPYLEAPEQTFARLGALSVEFDNPLRNQRFVVVAWPLGADLVYAAGSDAHNRSIGAPIPRLKSIIAREGLPRPSADAWRRAERELLDVGTQLEALRRHAWRIVVDATARPGAQSMSASDISGVMVRGGKVHVVRRGDDPDLDRLVHELAQAQRSATARVSPPR